LYYGSEIGMSGDKDKGDDIRQDFPGGWEADETMLLSKKAELRTNIL
jgi:glycosidase